MRELLQQVKEKLGEERVVDLVGFDQGAGAFVKSPIKWKAGGDFWLHRGCCPMRAGRIKISSSALKN
jgi:hypothetical protein